MPKSAIFFTLAIILTIILISLIRQISDALESGNRLDLAVTEVGNLQSENKKLKIMLETAKSYDSIEELLRNKLNMKKPGETIVIIPKEKIQNLLDAQNKKEEVIKIPNWQSWLRLFI